MLVSYIELVDEASMHKMFMIFIRFMRMPADDRF